MATRFKSTDLQEMIRKIVRQEMKEVVAATINEVLSERYLKQLAENARPRGVGPTMHIAGDDIDEEEAPSILRNATRGAYQHRVEDDDHVEPDEITNPMQEGANRDDVLSALFFEGTRPLNEIEERAGAGVPEASIAGLMQAHNRVPGAEDEGPRRPVTEVWKELAGVKKAQSRPTVSLEEMEKREETRLKMLRESLDRPVNG